MLPLFSLITFLFVINAHGWTVYDFMCRPMPRSLFQCRVDGLFTLPVITRKRNTVAFGGIGISANPTLAYAELLMCLEESQEGCLRRCLTQLVDPSTSNSQAVYVLVGVHESGAPLEVTQWALSVVRHRKGSVKYQSGCMGDDLPLEQIDFWWIRNRGFERRRPCDHPVLKEFCRKIRWLQTVGRCPGCGPYDQGVVFASYGGTDVTRSVRWDMIHEGGLSWGPHMHRRQLNVEHLNVSVLVVVLIEDSPPNSPVSRVFIINDHEECNITLGHLSHITEPTVDTEPPPIASDIIQANYGGKDVTLLVRDMFHTNPHGLFVSNATEVFGDGMVGVTKAFVVLYSIREAHGAMTHKASYWMDTKPSIIRLHKQ